MKRGGAFILITIAAVLWPLSFSFVFSRCSPQPRGILKRKQALYVLIDESAIEVEEDDDVYAEFIEHSNEKSVDDARLSDLLRDDEAGSWDSSKFQEVWRVMNLWSHRPGKNSPHNFEHLLRRVLQEKLAGNVHADAVDTLEMYNALIHSWAKSRTDGAPQRVEEIFDTMLRLYEAGEITFRPDIGTFNGVLMAYAFSREKASAKESMRVLRKLHNLRAEGRTDILPNTDSYSYILRAIATSEERDAPALVHQMIRNMEQFADKYPAVKPDWKCHNVYLHSLLSTMTMEVKNNAAIAEKMEKHLQEMITSDDKDVWPNIWSFNMVISAWSKSGSRKIMADRGEALFAQLEEYHASCGNSSETEPITNTYNCLIACYSRSNRPDKAERSVAILDRMKELYETHGKASQRPDVVTYNSVMNSYSKVRNSNPRMVEQLLRDLYAKYDETGDISFKPTSRSYNTCLDAWAKSDEPEAADKIMAWIDRMQASYDAGNSTVAPNKFTYHAYLEALAKTRRPDICDIAESVLETMEKKARNRKRFHLKPDVLTFTNVIHCLAVSGAKDAFERAYKILLRMEDLHASDYGDVRPNTYTYNCVINAVAKSNLLGKSKIAAKLLQRMKSVSLRPLTITYNNVLNACAFSDPRVENREEIVDIAMIMLKEAQETCGANFITYGTSLRVIGIFEDDKVRRWRFARDIFRKCCADGQLNKVVMNQLRFAVSPGQYSLLRQEARDETSGTFRHEFTVNTRGASKFKPRRVDRRQQQKP